MQDFLEQGKLTYKDIGTSKDKVAVLKKKVCIRTVQFYLNESKKVGRSTAYREVIIASRYLKKGSLSYEKDIGVTKREVRKLQWGF